MKSPTPPRAPDLSRAEVRRAAPDKPASPSEAIALKLEIVVAGRD